MIDNKWSRHRSWIEDPRRNSVGDTGVVGRKVGIGEWSGGWVVGRVDMLTGGGRYSLLILTPPRGGFAGGLLPSAKEVVLGRPLILKPGAEEAPPGRAAIRAAALLPLAAAWSPALSPARAASFSFSSQIPHKEGPGNNALSS
ncbi:hypothetical protein M0804_009260 [Polistes exclamans]|nr:hypothetical protein M0804_009260 [Polistes exclamans]